MDTSAARAAIFSRIRKAQQRPVEPTAAELDQVQTYLASNKAGPQPDVGNDLVLRFRTQAERTSQTVDEVTSLNEAPAAAARYLDSIGVARSAIAWETLSDIPWNASGLHIEFRPPFVRFRFLLLQRNCNTHN